VITIGSLEEGTVSMTGHEGTESIVMLRLDRPDLSHNVEVNGLGAWRGGQTSLVGPSVILVSVLHEVCERNLCRDDG